MSIDERNSILIVDDEKANIMTLTRILSPEYKIHAAKNGAQAITTAKRYTPDVILLDIVMPDMDGYEILTVLKDTEETREIPVIFISGLRSTEDEEKGLSLGAADYISKPFSPAIVKLRVRNQIQMHSQISMIRNLSMMDHLTGIPNRRNFESRLDLEWNRAIRTKSHLSILVIDLDNFKSLNDVYGHLQGDMALKATADIMKASLKRSVDFIARWGGEEFAAILPDTDLEGAFEIAESMRNSIEKHEIPYAEAGGGVIKITASIGINAIKPEHDGILENFLSKADEKLYEAKKSGKNKVCG